MRVTSKGQVTIPIAVREKLGILPHTEVAFEVHGNAARLIKVSAKKAGGRGAAIVDRLRKTGTIAMTTDQIMALTRKPQ